MKINIIILLAVLVTGQEAQAGSGCPQGDTACLAKVVDAKLDAIKRDIINNNKTMIASAIKEVKDELLAEAKKAGGEKGGGRKEFVLTQEHIDRIVSAVMKKLPAQQPGSIVTENEIARVADPMIKKAVEKAVEDAVAEEVAAQMPIEEASEQPPIAVPVIIPESPSHATFGLETIVVPKNGIFLIVQVGREGLCLRGVCAVSAGAGWSPDKDLALSAAASQLWGGEMFRFGLSASVAYDTGVLRGSPLVTFGAGPAVSWTPTEWFGLRSSLLLGMVGRRDSTTDRSDTGFRVTIPIAGFLRF